MSASRPVVMLANAGHKPLDTRIFMKEARSLAAAGWKVTLIIPHKENFERDGIRVESVPPPRKGWEQLIRCPYDIWKKSRRHPSNTIFHLHDSELLLVGLLLKWSGRTVIYDAHEDTPLQISYQHWIPWWLKGLYGLYYRVLEKMAGMFFDHIMVAEPVIAKYFPPRKVTLLRNFPIAASFRQEQPYHARAKQFVYVGLLSRPRGVENMLKGFGMAALADWTFVCGGKFAPAALEQSLLPQQGVDYRAWLPYEEMVRTLYASRAGVIVPQPNERYKTNYPVKLFEYLAAGMPVIASREGEAAAFVRACNGGILVEPENPSAMAEAFRTLAADEAAAAEMGKRGRDMIMQQYNWEKESEKLLELYRGYAS